MRWAETLPAGFGKPLFDHCDVGAREATVIMQCTRPNNGDGPLYPTAAGFEHAITAALGTKFSRADCPSWRGLPSNLGLAYIACYRERNGVLVSLYTEAPEQGQTMPRDRMRGNYDDYAFDVRAPDAIDWRVVTLRKMFSDVLSMAQRAPAAYTGPGWIRGVPSDTLAGSMATICRYNSINGRVGIACEYGNQYDDYFDSAVDVDRTVAAALPGFRRRECARPELNLHEAPRRLISCYTKNGLTVFASSLPAYGGLTLAFDVVDAAAPAAQTPAAK